MDRPWHALAFGEVIEALGTDSSAGLTNEEAADRLQEHGPNELVSSGGDGIPGRLLAQFGDVLIWVLLAAAATSGLVLGEWIDALVILAIVVLNGGLGFAQEFRAERALARLREMAAPEALVLRDGVPQSVPTVTLVPGDLLILEAGGQVSADARVVQALHLELDEASLTGESFPAPKTTLAVPESASLGDRRCIAFAGTSVSSGRGRAVVVATGPSTEVGRIAGVLARDEPSTPLQIELDRVGKWLGAIAVVTAGVVFVVGWLRGVGAESMFLTAVALAVAAIPEGLPAVVTITLSGGVQRMAERNAVVRRLPAVEALGAASVICTDKTGTITRNEIVVQQILTFERRISPEELEQGDARDQWFARIAALCNDAKSGPEGWVGDPTETSLVEAVVLGGGDPAAISAAARRVDEFAFDSSRKLMTTVHAWDGTFLLAVKGAPEEVLARCRSIQSHSDIAPFDEDRRTAASAAAGALAEKGWRTLALAYRIAEEVPVSAGDAERDLVLVAIVGMSDEARPEARGAVVEAQRAGITVVMVTGDHEVTARAIAGEVGILDGGEVMDGKRLRALSAEDLAAEVERYRVYSRIDPLDKVKIVDAWRAKGRVVAMTGDGVNDAPALRSADIGVAMGSGTDVAREAAAMVLTDDNFATIVAAVREGRSIFANLRTVVSFLLGSNASEVLLMLLGFLVFGGLGEPLLATQLLWINLITDGLPALALGVDPPDPDVMGRGPEVQRRMLPGPTLATVGRHGTLMALSGLMALALGHFALGYEWVIVQSMVFTSLVLIQLTYSLIVRSAGSGARPGRNPMLWWSIAGSVLLQLAVVYLPVGQTLFGTTPIPVAGWLPIFGAITIAAASVRGVDWLVGSRG